MPTTASISMYTGHRFYPLEPAKNHYDVRDIAHGLSLLCRFAGQGERFYSVAEHSLLVSRLLTSSPQEATDRSRVTWHFIHALHPSLRLVGLLHDASEAYMADVPAPIKALPQLDGYRQVEQQVMEAILTFLMRSPRAENWDGPSVHYADKLALRAEASMLGLLTPRWEVYPLPDVGPLPTPLSPQQAERRFLECYQDCVRSLGP